MTERLDRRALIEKARVQAQQNNIPAALEMYESAVAQDPRDWNTANAFADLLVRAKRADQAIAEYTKIGAHLLGAGFRAQARGIYKKILRVDPRHPEALRQLDACSAPSPEEQGGNSFYSRVLEAAHAGAADAASVPRQAVAPVAAPSPAPPPVPPPVPPAASAPPVSQHAPDPPAESSGSASSGVASAPGTQDLANWLKSAMLSQADTATHAAPGADAGVDPQTAPVHVPMPSAALGGWQIEHHPSAAASEPPPPWPAPVTTDVGASEAPAEPGGGALASPTVSGAGGVQDALRDLRASFLASVPEQASGDSDASTAPLPSVPVMVAPPTDLRWPWPRTEPQEFEWEPIAADASPDAVLAAWREQWLDTVATRAEAAVVEATRLVGRQQWAEAASLFVLASLTPHLRHRASRSLARMLRRAGDMERALGELEWAASVPAPTRQDGWDLALDIATTLRASGQPDLADAVLREVQQDSGWDDRTVSARIESFRDDVQEELVPQHAPPFEHAYR
jgi:thioredoxin-like negative regulator of GroEL